MKEVITGMPDNLIFVRHGQSEGNAKKREFEKTGNESVYTEEFRNLHESQYLLTDLGFKQAEKAGEYLKDLGLTYDRAYNSNIVRAQLTAATLGLPLEWFEHEDLREHEGGLDYQLLPSEKEQSFLVTKLTRFRKDHPFLYRPLAGESMADTCQRVKGVLNTIGRECGGQNVIITCHGNVIRATRMILERMPLEKRNRYMTSDEEWARVPNCSIFHYSRINPVNGEREKYLNWLQISSPSEERYDDWIPIERPRFTNEQLIERAYQNSGRPMPV